MRVKPPRFLEIVIKSSTQKGHEKKRNYKKPNQTTVWEMLDLRSA
jgi:hypothetical protein